MGRSSRSVVVLWPAKLRFGVYYEGCMSRRRWLAMRLLPLIMLSVIPACILALMQGVLLSPDVEVGLTILMVVNALGSGGDVIAITKKSTNRDLALKFAHYIMSKEVQKIFVTDLGWPPIRSDAMAEVQEWQKPFFKAVTRALEYGCYRPPIIGWSAVDKYANLAFKAIVIEGKAIKENLNRYANELIEELESIR